MNKSKKYALLNEGAPFNLIWKTQRTMHKELGRRPTSAEVVERLKEFGVSAYDVEYANSIPPIED